MSGVWLLGRRRETAPYTPHGKTELKKGDSSKGTIARLSGTRKGPQNAALHSSIAMVGREQGKNNSGVRPPPTMHSSSTPPLKQLDSNRVCRDTFSRREFFFLVFLHLGYMPYSV